MKGVRVILALTVSVVMSSLSASALELEQYQWKNRILLLNADDVDQSAAQMQRFLDSQAECEERDLIIFEITEGEVSRKFGFNKTVFSMVLIGKDGGVKKRFSSLTEMSEVFEIIDSMPMRRREMKQK